MIDGANSRFVVFCSLRNVSPYTGDVQPTVELLAYESDDPGDAASITITLRTAFEHHGAHFGWRKWGHSEAKLRGKRLEAQIAAREFPLMQRVLDSVEELRGIRRNSEDASTCTDWASIPKWTSETAHQWATNKEAVSLGKFKSTTALREYRKPARVANMNDDGRGIDVFGQVFFTPPNSHPVYLRSTIRKPPKK